MVNSGLFKIKHENKQENTKKYRANVHQLDILKIELLDSESANTESDELEKTYKIDKLKAVHIRI